MGLQPILIYMINYLPNYILLLDLNKKKYYALKIEK